MNIYLGTLEYHTTKKSYNSNRWWSVRRDLIMQKHYRASPLARGRYQTSANALCAYLFLYALSLMQAYDWHIKTNATR